MMPLLIPVLVLTLIVVFSLWFDAGAAETLGAVECQPKQPTLDSAQGVERKQNED